MRPKWILNSSSASPPNGTSYRVFGGGDCKQFKKLFTVCFTPVTVRTSLKNFSEDFTEVACAVSL